jgi:putative transposase
MSGRKGHSKRPPRLKLFSDTDPYYFITFNTRFRNNILALEPVHSAFTHYAEMGTQRGAWVGRYVIMPDHIHLFIWLNESGPVLSEWIRGLKRILSKEISGNGIEIPHWQPGFFDHVIRNSESDRQKWEYVRMNPVRAGLVKKPDDWPFSGEINRI